MEQVCDLLSSMEGLCILRVHLDDPDRTRRGIQRWSGTMMADNRRTEIIPILRPLCKFTRPKDYLVSLPVLRMNHIGITICLKYLIVLVLSLWNVLGLMKRWMMVLLRHPYLLGKGMRPRHTLRVRTCDFVSRITKTRHWKQGSERKESQPCQLEDKPLVAFTHHLSTSDYSSASLGNNYHVQITFNRFLRSHILSSHLSMDDTGLHEPGMATPPHPQRHLHIKERYIPFPKRSWVLHE